jgi:hypothetical protein
LESKAWIDVSGIAFEFGAVGTLLQQVQTLKEHFRMFKKKLYKKQNNY